MNSTAPSKQQRDDHGEKPDQLASLAQDEMSEKILLSDQGESSVDKKVAEPERKTPLDKGVPEETGQPHKRQGPPKRLVLAIALVICLWGAIASYPAVVELLSTVETDDAYVTGHVHQVSAKIAGSIETVLVRDNQWVNKGQLVATIDPRDEQVEVEKAEAHLAKAERDTVTAKHVVVAATRNYSAASENSNGSISESENSITRAQAGIRAAEAEVKLSKQQLLERQAQLHKTELDLERYTFLAKEGAVRTESLDSARRDHDVALADRDSAVQVIARAESKLNQAHADLKMAKSQLISAKATAIQADAANAQVSVESQKKASSEAAMKEAQADMDNAKLRLSYTKIVAPVSGRVGKKTVEEGQRVQTGAPLMAVVSKDKWIVANFKETQLKAMRVGQRVKISVDAFADHEFTGRVESFSPASGASFALLPPDNATGNFTKIVQRVPVKIVFDNNSLGQFEELIAPGMSCTVKVTVR